MSEDGKKERRARYSGPISIENVGVEQELPPIKRVDLSEYIGLVEQSEKLRSQGHKSWAIGITVNGEAALLVAHRLRMAARHLGVGLNLQTLDHDSSFAVKYNLLPTQKRIVFETADRRVGVGRKKKNPEAGSEAPKRKSGLPRP